MPNIVRGQSAITSLSLIWKYITSGKRNITKYKMLINYFSRWNVTWNTQQYVITQKTTTKRSVWNWHLFLNSFVCTISFKFHLKNNFSLNTTETDSLNFLRRVATIYYSTTFLERFMVFVGWSCFHSWWIMIHFNIAVVHIR